MLSRRSAFLSQLLGRDHDTAEPWGLFSRGGGEEDQGSLRGGDGIQWQTDNTFQTGPCISSVLGVLKLEKQLPRAEQTLLYLHSSVFSLPHCMADTTLLLLLYLPVCLPGRFWLSPAQVFPRVFPSGARRALGHSPSLPAG